MKSLISQLILCVGTMGIVERYFAVSGIIINSYSDFLAIFDRFAERLTHNGNRERQLLYILAINASSSIKNISHFFHPIHMIPQRQQQFQ